ncbi:unnamed protein product [Protopolystoma xenopodis]|uniref:Uncharacterized protein n=1 Tax=Protopolystoma xenopodis TaxID=117903 RepID=A0A448X3G6_9PLAT|nr:unnamed protein product [Protopolystoma xenopodis]
MSVTCSAMRASLRQVSAMQAGLTAMRNYSVRLQRQLSKTQLALDRSNRQLAACRWSKSVELRDCEVGPDGIYDSDGSGCSKMSIGSRFGQKEAWQPDDALLTVTERENPTDDSAQISTHAVTLARELAEVSGSLFSSAPRTDDGLPEATGASLFAQADEETGTGSRLTAVSSLLAGHGQHGHLEVENRRLVQMVKELRARLARIDPTSNAFFNFVSSV